LSSLDSPVRALLLTALPVGNEEEEEGDGLGGALDIRRMAQIVYAKASDHAGEVVILPKENFNIEKTIFASLESAMLKKVQAAKIGVTLFWSDAAALKIQSAFARVPRAPKYDRALVEFMQTKCTSGMAHVYY
jgi:hypothetical protein